MKEVILSISGGVVTVEQVPAGIKVRVRDYDIMEDSGSNETYIETVWEGD